MKNELILIGGGGHCKACIDVIEQQGEYKIKGIVDLPEHKNKNILGYQIIATDEDLPKLAKKDFHFLITIGQIKTAHKRQLLFEQLAKLAAPLATIVSPTAYVSPHSHIRQGTIIMHHALVNAAASIGNNCIINTSAVIEHDVIVEEHCHVSTGAIVNGGAHLKKCSFVGSRSIIREGVTIGGNCIIGAGATIMNNVAPNSIIKP